jgi:hypothetical protein
MLASQGTHVGRQARDRQAGRRADKLAEQASRQVGRQVGRQAGRQTDRQACITRLKLVHQHYFTRSPVPQRLIFMSASDNSDASGVPQPTGHNGNSDSGKYWMVDIAEVYQNPFIPQVSRGDVTAASQIPPEEWINSVLEEFPDDHNISMSAPFKKRILRTMFDVGPHMLTHQLPLEDVTWTPVHDRDELRHNDTVRCRNLTASRIYNGREGKIHINGNSRFTRIDGIFGVPERWPVALTATESLQGQIISVKAANLEKVTTNFHRSDYYTALWLWSAVEGIPRNTYLKKIMEITATYPPAMQDNWSALTYQDRRPHIERSMSHLLTWSEEQDMLALHQRWYS